MDAIAGFAPLVDLHRVARNESEPAGIFRFEFGQCGEAAAVAFNRDDLCAGLEQRAGEPARPRSHLVNRGTFQGAGNGGDPLQQLAADAARTAIAGLDEAERNELVSDFLAANADSYALIDPGRLTATIGDKPGDPDHYRVVLTYDAGNLPIWNLYPPLPLPSQQIAYSSTIKRGGI